MVGALPCAGSGTAWPSQHDVRLRAAARAIYDTCYPGDEWAPVGFEEAERYRTIHYPQAVGAALEARPLLAARMQPELFETREFSVIER